MSDHAADTTGAEQEVTRESRALHATLRASEYGMKSEQQLVDAAQRDPYDRRRFEGLLLANTNALIAQRYAIEAMTLELRIANRRAEERNGPAGG